MLIAGQNLITFTLITKEEYNLHIRKEKKITGRRLDSQSCCAQFNKYTREGLE